MQAILFMMTVISMDQWQATGRIDYKITNVVSGYSVDDCMRIAHDANAVSKLKVGAEYVFCAPQIFDENGDQINPDGKTSQKRL